MPCNNCGGALEQVHIDEVDTGSKFTEEYECVNCGARGFVRGVDGQPPREWDHAGKAFGGV